MTINETKGDILKQNVLLVEPKFPTRTKSKNHKNFLPIGLLKLAAYYKQQKNYNVELVRGNTLPEKFETPKRIEITSLFTYWSKYVWDAIKFYRENYPDPDKTEIRLGGIYVSLHCNEKELQDKCEKYNVIPIKGVQEYAEKYFPAYEELGNNGDSIDYQIVHSSRGCHRKCSFCGTWIIEPDFKGKKSILPIIEPGLEKGIKNLVFYDNNLFYNPHIEDILNELIELKKQRKIGWCESQSGFDGRILLEKPELASLMKKAGFRYPRLAWDWGYNQHSKFKKQITILNEAGYSSRNIYVFMIYNWDLDFKEMEKKRIKCWEWNVQISDCRNRPLTQLHDNYKPLRDQNDGVDYHINPNWTDAEVKQFRKNVRKQNICVRQNNKYHSKLLEVKKHYTKEQYVAIKTMYIKDARRYLPDLWIPSKISRPKDKYKWSVERVIKPDIPFVYPFPQTKVTCTTHVPNIRHTRTQRITPPLRPQA